MAIRIILLCVISIQGLVACPIGDSNVCISGTRRDPVPSGVFYWSEALAVDTQCTGEIDRVKYCYHNSPNLVTNSTQAHFSLYRRAGAMYNRVSEIFTITNRISFDSESFVCEYLELGTALQVQARDVFGVCLPDVATDDILPIVSDFPGAQSLNSLPCEDQPLDSFFRFTVPTRGLRIHLFAESSAAGTSEATIVNGPPTSPSDDPLEQVTDSTTEGTPRDTGGGAGRAAGIAFAVLFVVLVICVVVVVTIVVVIWKRRKLNYVVKPKSTLARNGLTTSTTVGFSTYDYVEEGNNYAEITDKNLTDTESVSVAVDAPTTAVYDNPQLFIAQRKPSRGKNHEGYYCPDAVMYSELASKEVLKRDSNPYQAPANQEHELYGQLKQYGITKINRNELEAQEHLGSGQFGWVEKGLWKRNGKEMEVAIKSMKESEENAQNKLKLLQEAVIMAQFQHPNVLYLCGVARQGETIVLVTELALRGDLKKHLVSLKSEYTPSSDQLPQLLLSFSLHIACGMEYLSTKGFIHRDLAARNILVTESNICKVADFGMSRDLVDGTYYVSTGGRIPLKWTAPESLHYAKYSTASDVWSYGCVLYEIWSLGRKPFTKMRNKDVIEFIDAGKRLTPPPGTPRVIYQTMISCWHPDRSSRPDFHNIITALQDNDKLVLMIPTDDESSHPNAAMLGAPLEAGSEMYPDLCTQYSRYSTTADEESEEDDKVDNSTKAD